MAKTGPQAQIFLAAAAASPPVFRDGLDHPFGFFDVTPEMLGHVFGGRQANVQSRTVIIQSVPVEATFTRPD
jgi:hypothetical protein